MIAPLQNIFKPQSRSVTTLIAWLGVKMVSNKMLLYWAMTNFWRCTHTIRPIGAQKSIYSWMFILQILLRSALVNWIQLLHKLNHHTHTQNMQIKFTCTEKKNCTKWCSRNDIDVHVYCCSNVFICLKLLTFLFVRVYCYCFIVLGIRWTVNIFAKL